MPKFLNIVATCVILSACAQETNLETQKSENKESTEEQVVLDERYVLNDFLSVNEALDQKVDEIFERLSPEHRVAQLIMPAIGEHGQKESVIDELVKDQLIGGILLLNGTKEEFKNWVDKYDRWNDSLNTPPFLYSADAEPSLINRKIRNSAPVPRANTVKSGKEVIEVAELISAELNEIGINYNFAPVVDVAPNKTVGWRGFGHAPDSLITWSNLFVKSSQDKGVIATAKHFPGHGNVVGDTHKKLLFIDGEMTELENYPSLIENGVLSIMVAHIAVINNEKYGTNGLPATTSKAIVTDLLRDSLNFQGLIVTDAMNMGGVKDVENASILAVKAGCDIVLMPLNARATHAELLNLYNSDNELKKQVDESAKRILRMKLCLGWSPTQK